jgi:long-chain acyl-CoA synthetase
MDRPVNGAASLELSGLIACHASYRPDRLAVVADGQRLDWRSFHARVARAANLLRSLGIRPGNRVATCAGNCLELLEAYWAVPAIGATLVPLSPLLMADGLSSLLRDCAPACLLASAELLPVLADVDPALGGRRLLIDGEAPGYGNYAALAARQSEEFKPARANAADPYNIMYTSGTTGQPKGIVHSHFIRSMYCATMASALRVRPESRVLHTGAIVFNGAFVTMMPCFYLGGTYVLHRRFDPEATLAAIEAEAITHVMVVPAQLAALLDAPRFDPRRLSSLECVLSLGAPLLAKHRAAFEAVLPGRLYELYGLTEGMLTILDPESSAAHPGSVGRPPPFFGIRVLREDGSEAAPGEVGEIVGRGPILMDGYLGRPDLTAEAVRDGWMHSGDMGFLDADGYLHLVDRMKDMIDSGGVKVYPRDIEEVIARHPGVREVAVFGIPDDKWGEAPMAAVVARAGAAPDAAELRDWTNDRVAARYQRVARVVVMAELPRNAAGKVLKRELREPFWRPTGRVI